MNIKKSLLILLSMLLPGGSMYSAHGEYSFKELSNRKRERSDYDQSGSDESHKDSKRKFAGSGNDSSKKRVLNFQDEVINNFQTNFVVLREGFELLGLDYSAFLESKRSLISEDGNADMGADDINFMHEIVTEAENIIIETMQNRLCDGFSIALLNNTDLDVVNKKIWNYALANKYSLGAIILQFFNIEYLPYAANCNNLIIIQTLMEAGLDINSRDLSGDTALMRAATNFFIKLVPELIDYGADVNIQNTNGNTALIYASNTGSLGIVQMLIAAGADVDIQNVDGSTALMDVSWKGFIEIVQELIAAGADVDIQNVDGNTALMIAVEDRSINVVQELIEAGVDLEIRNVDGDTALMIAVKNDFTEIVQMLIAAGANTDYYNFLPNHGFNIVNPDMLQVILTAFDQREIAERQAAELDSFDFNFV